MFQKTAHDCWCLFGRNSTFALWDQIIPGYHIPKTPPSSPSSTAHHTHSFQSFKALKRGETGSLECGADSTTSLLQGFGFQETPKDGSTHQTCGASSRKTGGFFWGRDEWLAGRARPQRSGVKGDIYFRCKKHTVVVQFYIILYIHI